MTGTELHTHTHTQRTSVALWTRVVLHPTTKQHFLRERLRKKSKRLFKTKTWTSNAWTLKIGRVSRLWLFLISVARGNATESVGRTRFM